MHAASKQHRYSVARSSLDLSDRALLEPLAGLLAAVQRAAGETPFLLIGAAARDLLLVYAGGIAAQRATEDTDVALAVRSREEFMRLRAALLAMEGGTAGGPLHQLWLGDQRLRTGALPGPRKAPKS
jgi:predicted nucleotidyltransferase